MKRTQTSPKPANVVALEKHLAATQQVWQILQSRRPLLNAVEINADVVRNPILSGLSQLRRRLITAAADVHTGMAAEWAGDPSYRFTREHDLLIRKIDTVLAWITANFDVNNAWDLDPTSPDGLRQRTYTTAGLAPLAVLLDALKVEVP